MIEIIVYYSNSSTFASVINNKRLQTDIKMAVRLFAAPFNNFKGKYSTDIFKNQEKISISISGVFVMHVHEY